jgi:hemoglobin-like flavoprotein
MNEGYGITDKFYDRLFGHDANLDASWHHHREARLARAQY